MENLIQHYKQRLNLPSATFTQIIHEDAIIALVFKVVDQDGRASILKIGRRADDYKRDLFFLKLLSASLPVPRILGVVNPDEHVRGAVLMECYPGRTLRVAELTDALAFKCGQLLAHVHQHAVSSYGDAKTAEVSLKDPRIFYEKKFMEALDECRHNLAPVLIDKIEEYYLTHRDLLLKTDGPCVIHRDFRPGNIIVHDGQIQGIIDWTAARFGFAEEDFVTAEIGEWDVHGRGTQPFFDGYTSVRPVSSVLQDVMPLLLIGRSIMTLGFLFREDRVLECKNLYEKYYAVLKRVLG